MFYWKRQFYSYILVQLNDLPLEKYLRWWLLSFRADLEKRKMFLSLIMTYSFILFLFKEPRKNLAAREISLIYTKY